MNHTPDRKSINAWCMYDWANSAFATTLMAAMIPIFFRRVAAISMGSSDHLATSLWGYTASIAMLFVAILALLLGPVADFSGTKKRFLALFTGLGVLGTALLVLTGPGDWIWVSLLFIVGSIGFAGGEVFYDSLLPHLAPPFELNKISTLGYAFGYLGGGLLLVLNIGMIWFLPKVVIAAGSEPFPLMGMKLSFISVAIWWAVFSVPLFRRVPEPPGIQQGLQGTNPFVISASRLYATFRDIRKYKNLFLFLLAYWLYNDGVGTIMKMATAYGDEIGISTLDMIGALLLTQAVGIPCSLLFGKIAQKTSEKKAILLAIIIYIGISAGGALITHPIHFWVLAFLVGLVMGGIQALSRSLFASMIPPSKSAEFFSFYTISGKFAGIAGPAVFSLAGQLTGSSRAGVFSLVFFFAAGGLLLMRVHTKKQDQAGIRALDG